jgi:hypothetical protein
MGGDIREGAGEGKRKARARPSTPSRPIAQKFAKTLEAPNFQKPREKLAKHFKNGSERQPSFSKTFLGRIGRYQWLAGEKIWSWFLRAPFAFSPKRIVDIRLIVNLLFVSATSATVLS